MTVADDPQSPQHASLLNDHGLSKSLDAIAALRVAMERRLADATIPSSPLNDKGMKETSPPVGQERRDPLPSPASAEGADQQKKKEEPLFFSEKKERKRESLHFDPQYWMPVILRLSERVQKLMHDYVERMKGKPLEIPHFDPAHVSEAFAELTSRILNHPERFVEAQLALWQGYAHIWQTTLAKLQGKEAPVVAAPSVTDKRFQDKDWQNVWLFDFVKQSYLLTADWVHHWVQQEAGALDPKLAQKLKFYTRQYVDALSPSNFWMTNPEVLRTTIASGGENLIKGLENMLDDLERGQGMLSIRMTDNSAFKVGENLATTKGRIVFENELMQLIQYAPMTGTVHAVPLLIIPPWINKFYILDLREKNSFIRYCVSQGFTVFCISWVNPTARHGLVNFEDYVTSGIVEALRQIKSLMGCEQVNAVGYCIGGTALAMALSYLQTIQNNPSQAMADVPRVSSATYLVTMIDFKEAGDLSVFIDEDQVRAIEARMAKQGFLDAAAMATTFNLLRSNDLIWSFVVNNYLLGKDPFPFDILYWNTDSTNLPAVMQSYYLRKMYMGNKLIEVGGVQVADVPIDLYEVTTPSFLLSAQDDHIAPWRSTYRATHIYKGDVRFVLAGSGHIAGVINPPAANKYGYWTNDSCPENPDEWLDGAVAHKGSWWPEWISWLRAYAGGEMLAPPLDDEVGIEPAPGRYVKVKALG